MPIAQIAMSKKNNKNVPADHLIDSLMDDVKGMKKAKSSAADHLIDSLMDDLQDIQAESSYNKTDYGEFEFEVISDDIQFPEGADSDGDKTTVVPAGDVAISDPSKDFDPILVFGDSSSPYSSSEQQIGYSNTSEKKFYDKTGEYSPNDNDNSNQDLGAPEGFEPPVLQKNESQNLATAVAESDYKPKSIPVVPNLSIPEIGPEPTPFFTSTSIFSSSEPVSEEKTVSLAANDQFGILDLMSTGESTQATHSESVADANNSTVSTDEKTLAVEGFANAKIGLGRKNPDLDVKVSIGNFRGSGRVGGINVLTSVDASLAQAESLKVAQYRIIELEKEIENLRAENEELASAGEIIKSRADTMASKVSSLEKEKQEIHESAQNEIIVLKGGLQYKEAEFAKASVKVEELETRLKSDFKKIRVRERELENRLELLRAEKAALVRSKDDYILDQKRKIDQLSQELDNYRKKCLELNKALEANQDQFKRTERALRLALTNLEVKEGNLAPIKKAE